MVVICFKAIVYFVLTSEFFLGIRQGNLENFYPKRIVKIKL